MKRIILLYKANNAAVKNAVNIFLCFLLSSTGFFLWLYNLRSLSNNEMSDIMTTVIGYLLQAAGILIFSFVKGKGNISSKGLFITSVGIYFLFLVPSAISHSLSGALVFGFLNSLLCGIMAGYYLCRLADEVEKNKTALTFGIGYALSTIISWLMSYIVAAYFVNISLIICLILSALIISLNIKNDISKSAQCIQPITVRPEIRKTLILFVLLIISFSLLNNIGFYFQSLNAKAMLGIESSRMLYAAGLIFAGIISDKSRKNGAICALASLAVPFITLALRGETLPLTIFWALSYFAFGFYSVFRFIAVSDFAKKNKLSFLAASGLLFGRVGDSLGAGLNIAIRNERVILVIIAALCFALSVFLFFIFYQKMYVPESVKQKSEKEIFNAFASKHDLSQRERGVFRLLISEKTNKEIAEELFVSESTVKFHIHNLLKKTGAKNRLELLSLYNESAH